MSTDLDSRAKITLDVDQTVQLNQSWNQNKCKKNSISSSSEENKENSKSVKKEGIINVVESEEDPLTPTSEENKIPAPRSPPPAPRKRRCGVVTACRKKLDFLNQHQYPQLVIPKEEVLQEFFASSFDHIHSRRLLKRRCPCV